MQRVVPQILQGMEGFDKKSSQAVLFMVATNVPRDSALGFGGPFVEAREHVRGDGLVG